jgi:RNA-dependent RNA polymerase
LALDLLNVPKEVNTHDVYDAFSKEGHIMNIDLWEDSNGEPASKGRIRFRLAFLQIPCFE